MICFLFCLILKVKILKKCKIAKFRVKNGEISPEFSPNLSQEKPQILGSKVAFRSYSIDRFMICGAFYDENFYKNAYKGLMWHKKKPQITPPPHIPLFMSLAHGSRGFASAIIAARYITALICDFCNTTRNKIHSDINENCDEIYKKTCEKTHNEIYKEVCENTCTEPLFIPRKFIREIHPARFLIHTLKIENLKLLKSK